MRGGDAKLMETEWGVGSDGNAHRHAFYLRNLIWVFGVYRRPALLRRHDLGRKVRVIEHNLVGSVEVSPFRIGVNGDIRCFSSLHGQRKSGEDHGERGLSTCLHKRG